MTDLRELLPCPFCGESNALFSGWGYGSAFSCGTCHAKAPSADKDDWNAAETAWNRRAAFVRSPNQTEPTHSPEGKMTDLELLRECRVWLVEGGAVYLVERIDAALVRSPNQTEQGWIPVSERLPQLTLPILTFKQRFKRMAIDTCERRTYVGNRDPWFYDDPNNEVTHWMPLPEPPSPTDWLKAATDFGKRLATPPAGEEKK